MYYDKLILEENPQAFENDRAIVRLAMDKSFCEGGWEDLIDRCITNAAKRAIDAIEARKYHLEESKFGMI